MTPPTTPAPDSPQTRERWRVFPQPKLRVIHTVGNYWRVEIHGQDYLRDGPRNYAVMDIGRGATKAEALEQARAWFSTMEDKHEG